MPFLQSIISGSLSFAASLSVVVCTNTGVTDESTEITTMFNTLYLMSTRRLSRRVECLCYYY